jgi:homogentisate 1,2-dioxygenase
LIAILNYQNWVLSVTHLRLIFQGANGLANPKDFFYPTAAFDAQDKPFDVIAKFAGKFFKAKQVISNPLLDKVGPFSL